MRKSLLAATLVTTMINTTMAGALTWIQSPVNGHWYATDQAATWSAAETTAQALGGHLATIRNAAEETWVIQTFLADSNDSGGVWIGFNDAASEGTFAWSSGESPSYTNWAPSEPSNGDGKEDYTHIWGPAGHFPHQWNDLPDELSWIGPVRPLYEVDASDCDMDGVPDSVDTEAALPEYGVGCAGQGGIVPQLEVCGQASGGGSLVLNLDDSAPESTALVLLGVFQASLPAAGSCTLLVTPVLTVTPSFPTGGSVGAPGSGGFALPVTIPAGTPPATVQMQVFVGDDTNPWGYAASNGVSVSIL